MPSAHLDYCSGPSLFKNLPNPPGFYDVDPSSTSNKKRIASTSASNNASQSALKQKRAWDLAISPAKSLPMNGFMLYMSGGGVQIFSMGIVAMLLLSPFKAVASLNSSFRPFQPSDKDGRAYELTLQKLVYVGCNALTLALGLWKCWSMGLLPTGSADWLAFESRNPAPELSL